MDSPSTTSLKVTKRKRSENFTKEEELHLLEEIHKYKNIIECKTTNKVSCLEKENAWKKIVTALNAKGLKPRTVEQLKSKYDNLKTKARKDVSGEKKYVKQTGGGPSYPDSGSNPVTEAVLNIINYKTVVGLESCCDSDYVDTTKKSTETVQDDHFQILSAAQNIRNPSPIVDHRYDIDEEPCQQNVNVQHSPLPADITAAVVKNGISNLNLDSQEKESTNTLSTQNAWKKYVPRMLKQQTSAKLRPIKRNPVHTAKEEYYKRKLQWLNENDIAEKSEREKRMKREDEIHQQQMTLLKLKIELKMKELDNFSRTSFLIN